MDKKTALYNMHVYLGAKMVPFAGFEMPVQYSGVTEEHFAVREKVGIFDITDEEIAEKEKEEDESEKEIRGVVEKK